ncbi:MAG TPA: SLC13 family permease [Longimicrobiales bacterium]|nr:SLC13 family permease [Longimicrobiales bacterium]
MDLAWISLAALVIAVVGGIVMRLNVGLLSFALAYLVGVGLGDMSPGQVTGGFPTSLFLVLTAVMLLFAQALVNGTLSKLALKSVGLARGNVGMVPIIFFGLTVTVAVLGGGNIAAAALIAPVAMSAAGGLGISGFLMVIMVGNGANAGAYSPIAPTGIVANELMAQAGLDGVEWQTFWNTFIAQSFVAFAGYLLLGGGKLLRSGRAVDEHAVHIAPEDREPLTRAQWITLVVTLGLLASIIFLDVDIVVGAFVAMAILLVARVSDEEKAIAAVPWGTILMICGVSTLISVLAETGGIDVIVDGLVAISTPTSVTGMVAFVAGIISAYSSTVGVVLPTFLPTVPGLAERLGADALAIASSINVGGHLVDVSPLSTIGALCVAAAAPTEDRRVLFNQVLAWGLSMSVVGAIVCWVFFGLL